MELKSALLVMATVVPPLLLLLFAWRAWTKRDNLMVSGYRRILFGAGAAATVLSLLFFVLLAFFAPEQLFWSGGGFWASLVGVVLCCFGKGKSRALGIVFASLIWAVWLILAWGPP
jgi:hypothetical protein